jgi:hypothetical protein
VSVDRGAADLETVKVGKAGSSDARGVCFGFGQLVAVLLALGLIASVPSASAAGVHPYLPALSLTGGASDPGSSHPAQAFDYPCGDAVDSHGDVYVANYEHGIDIFNASGEFIKEVAATHPCGLAVDSLGNLYVFNAGGGRVELLEPDSYPPTPSTSYGAPTVVAQPANGIAINPANDHLFVAFGGAITEYSSAASGNTSLGTFGSGVAGANYFGVDVRGSNGDVYALDTAHNSVYVFGASGALKQTIDGTNVPAFPGGFSFSGGFGDYLAVDQANGDVYVGDMQTHHVVDQFTAGGAYVSQIDHLFTAEDLSETAEPFSDAEPTDIAVAPPGTPNAGNVYVSVVGHLYAFGPLTRAPSMHLVEVQKGGPGTGEVVSSPTGIACGSACTAEFNDGTTVTLTATATAGSEFVGWSGGGCSGKDTCEVEVSEDTAVSAEFALIQHTLEVLKTGTGAGHVEADSGTIDCGASCSAEYVEGSTITLTATANSGSAFTGWSGAGCSGVGVCEVTLGADATVSAQFVSRPVISAESASAVGETGATISAEVNPNGNVTSCQFQYGVDTSYGQTAPCPSEPGHGTGTVKESVTLGGLAPGTLYHYRLVATNAAGETQGTGATFTTAPATCATDSSLCPPPPSCATDPALCPPPPPAGAGELAVSRVATVHGKDIMLRLRCVGPPSWRCQGQATVAVVARGRQSVIAKGRYDLATGDGVQVVRVHLNGTGKRLLRTAGGKMHARVSGVGARTFALTLKVGAKHRHGG